MKEKVLFCWSGGKDSAYALNRVLNLENFEVVALLTTFTSGYKRVSMHGIREELIDRQAESLGLPLDKMFIHKNCTQQDYDELMEKTLIRYKQQGVGAVAFGDIFLEDLRQYREDRLAALELKTLFPLWKEDTAVLAREFIEQGFKCIISCVDTNVIDKDFSGRNFDKELLSSFPGNIDPCGENGEFHSFVFDGPGFSYPISYNIGEKVLKDDRFFFCDLLPGVI